MKYETRVVAFIDILGFKNLINQTTKDDEDNESKINEIISSYESIIDIWEGHQDYASSKSKKVSIFSDSIVISFLIDENSEVFHTLLELKWLIMSLLKQKILCRGAVSYGKFIHTDNYLFGPALVEAYLLESKAALYPRIILDKPIIDIGSRFGSTQHDEEMEKEYVESLLERDSDGMYFIDYFSKAEEELDEPEFDFPMYIENLREIIQKGLMASSHHSKADLRIKFSWMRERFNSMIDQIEKNISENDMGDIENLSLKKISPNKYNKYFG